MKEQFEGRLDLDWDKVVWKHRQLVEKGVFDAIPLTEFEEGETVVSKFSDKIYEVFEVSETQCLVGYDFEGEVIRGTIFKKDLRSIVGYAKAMYGMFQPGNEIIIDKKGHITIEYNIAPAVYSDRRN